MSTHDNGTDEICITCGRIELIYSIPPKSSDTTTRAKFESGNLQCKECTLKQKEGRRQQRENRRQAKKQKLDNIKQLEESKVQTFRRYWRDVSKEEIPLNTVDNMGTKIVNLPEQRRLMWIYIENELRGPAHGFLASEEMKVIREDQLQSLIQSVRQGKQEITNHLLNEEITKEQANKMTTDLELEQKTQIKKLVSSVDRLHGKANKEWENKPEDEWERMVKKPGYRDPEGNKAPRYHLLSDKPTYHQRHALRQRQINNIERVDKIEDQISDKNQKRLFDEGQANMT